MAERWILDASPLIVLCKINYEYLLFQLVTQIVIPTAVVAEIQAGPEYDPARLFLQAGAIPTVEAPLPPESLVNAELGAGETAVIAWALANPGWTAILDDGAARRFARMMAIPMRGTLSLIVLARRKSIVGSATEVLFKLRHAGFYLDDRVIRKVLKESVDEDWPL